jgi:hypothetical protein
VFVSRAPQADIERVKARMGWQMPWYTITDATTTTASSHGRRRSLGIEQPRVSHELGGSAIAPPSFVRFRTMNENLQAERDAVIGS